jgi:hypothetical protein
MTMSDNRLLLLGCGILQKELRFLIEKNRWPLDTFFLDSALHVDFDDLSRSLTSALARYSGRNIIVFYGSCHPLMDKILEAAKTIRTTGQNCVEMLLGHELFTEELSNGAFFLMEEWARRWDLILKKTLGDNEEVWKAVYQGDRKYIACINTPCSGDFRVNAEKAGKKVGLPLHWIDTPLDNLESVLQDAITRKMRETPCQI